MSWARLDRRQSQSGPSRWGPRRFPGKPHGTGASPILVPSVYGGGGGHSWGENFQQTLRPGGFICVIEEVTVFPLSALQGRLGDGLGPT